MDFLYLSNLFSKKMRRKLNVEVSGIGIFKSFFKAMLILGIFFNGFVLMFSSVSMYRLFGKDAQNPHDRIFVYIFVPIAENVLLFIFYMIEETVSDTPQWLEDRLAIENLNKVMDQKNKSPPSNATTEGELADLFNEDEL